MDLCVFCGLNHFRWLRTFPERDIVADRTGEQQRLLRDVADLVAQRFDIVFVQRLVVDKKITFRRFIQFRDQLKSVVFPEPVAPMIATVSFSLC